MKINNPFQVKKIQKGSRRLQPFMGMYLLQQRSSFLGIGFWKTTKICSNIDDFLNM